MQGICELLDASHPQRPYSATLREQTLEARGRAAHAIGAAAGELRTRAGEFRGAGAAALRAQAILSAGRAVCGRTAREFQAEVQQSLQQYAAIEAAPRGSFEDYLASYLAD